jgi:hypothetical protein
LKVDQGLRLMISSLAKARHKHKWNYLRYILLQVSSVNFYSMCRQSGNAIIFSMLFVKWVGNLSDARGDSSSRTRRKKTALSVFARSSTVTEVP